MSDPIATISALLDPVFAGLNGGEPADPTVRPLRNTVMRSVMRNSSSSLCDT